MPVAAPVSLLVPIIQLVWVINSYGCIELGVFSHLRGNGLCRSLDGFSSLKSCSQEMLFFSLTQAECISSDKLILYKLFKCHSMLGRDCKNKPQMSAGQKSEMQFRRCVFHKLMYFLLFQYNTVVFTQGKPWGSPQLTLWQSGSNLLTEWLFFFLWEEVGLESLDVLGCFKFVYWAMWLGIFFRVTAFAIKIFISLNQFSNARFPT